jgi:hypothetical protein
MDDTRARRLVWLLSAAFLLGPALPAMAERIASRAESQPAVRSADLAHVSDLVARALATYGLTPEQVDERLVRLSNDDLRRLAANLDQIQAAGNVPNYIWILLAVLIAVTIIATVF